MTGGGSGGIDLPVITQRWFPGLFRLSGTPE